MKKNHPPLSINEHLVPPQAPELEQAVLGALLVESTAWETIEDLLHPEDFYLPAHTTLFRAITRLRNRQSPVDLLTVMEELRSHQELDGIGGPLFLTELTANIASGAHIRYHAAIVKEKAHMRRIIRMAAELWHRAHDPAEDPDELLEDWEKQVTEWSTGLSGTASLPLPDVLKHTIQKVAQAEEIRKSGKQVAIPTGLKNLDKALAGGWHAPDLIILGAHPSMGKTQLALFFAKAAAQAGKPVLIVSEEMADTQLAGRYLLEDERIHPSHLRSGQMTPEEWNAMDETAGRLWELPIWIAAGHDIRYLHNIRSEARRLKRKGNLELLIVDHLGLTKTGQKFQNRYQEIGHITGELKNLAKELDIAVLLLSQLSRPAKGTGIRMPQLEDLRESGDIEQDADMVLIIHKPDYYDPATIDSKGVPWKGRGKLFMAKNREGIRNDQLIYYHDDRYKRIGDKPFIRET
ncbi:MAG: replicative DNA helicase [Tannerellaceae bacterium]|nr:replicative DNA helicase [Tannerellaceae bacterium]